jgi:hypothetical protein
VAESPRDDFPNNFVGDLVQTERGWVVAPPTTCPDGHDYMRRSLRAALPADLSRVTPHSLRRTEATVVRDARGPARAQQQLSHAKLATTEAHYLQRQTLRPCYLIAKNCRATSEREALSTADADRLAEIAVNCMIEYSRTMTRPR